MNALAPVHIALPSTLNLGSGKDFRADAFNIDIDDSWSPDAVLDLSMVEVDRAEVALDTHRFGALTLVPGCFDKIVANDVLEHVPNLTRLMTNCLSLLRMGGAFEISVPYDLSFGAWQDPTHVRAFNERSWLYYTDWFWYLGWDKARFALEHLQFVPSPVGEELRRQNLPRETILATPRAIDSMSVTLRKVDLGEEDRATWLHWRERRRQAQTLNRSAAPAPAPPSFSGKQSDAVIPDHLQAFPGVWSDHAERHCVWIVSPKDYGHQQAFEEIDFALSEGFAELGGSAPVVRHPSEWNGRLPIVLGGHLLSPNLALILPAGSIIYNLEQVDQRSAWLSEQYLGLMRRHPVLDFSHRNTAALKALGISHAQQLPFGYVPGLTRVTADNTQDIDVLFYGSLNERRAAILEQLRSHGLNVVHLFNVYAEERDAAIARAKLVLNIHFYDAAIFESARVSFLLANCVCVLSEGQEGDPDIAPFRPGLEICAYEHIVERCLALLADEPARKAIARRGFEAMRRFPQSELLRSCFAPAERVA